MKKVLAPTAGALLLAGGLASAQETIDSGHRLKAVVVSTDPAARTVTVRNVVMEPGTGRVPDINRSNEITLALNETAAARVAEFKPGEEVTLTCQPASREAERTPPQEATASTFVDVRTFCPMVTLMARADAGGVAAGSRREARTGEGKDTRPAPGAKGAGGKDTRLVAAEVVSTDANAKTITVRSVSAAPGPETATLSLQGKAVAALKQEDVKAGDRVTLTCRARAESGAGKKADTPDTADTREAAMGATGPETTSFADLDETCAAVTEIHKDGGQR